MFETSGGLFTLLFEESSLGLEAILQRRRMSDFTEQLCFLE